MKTNEVDEMIVFYKVKNEMPASAATAPYLGKIKPRGTLDEETFIAEMRENGCTESAETIRRILRGADTVQARRIGEKGNKVQTGAELMMPHLTGTLPTPDAKPGDDNELTVRIDPDDGLRLALSDMTPKENREDLSKLGGVRIYSVKSEGLDWSVLKGTQPFQIAGIGFRPTATSTVEVKVVSRKTGDAATATATCEDNQRITAQLGLVLAKGDYKVVVTVTDEGGLSGNTEASWNVKMLAAPQPPAPSDPVVSRIASGTAEGIVRDQGFEAHGERLSWSEGDTVSAIWTDDDGEHTLSLEPNETTPELMSFDMVGPFESIPDGTEMEFVFSLGGKTATATTTILAA